MSDRLVKGIKEAEKELEKQKLKKQEEEVHVQYVCNTLFAAYTYVYVHARAYYNITIYTVHTSNAQLCRLCSVCETPLHSVKSCLVLPWLISPVQCILCTL